MHGRYKEGDTIVAAHSFDATKDYLPLRYKSDYIKQDLENRLDTTLPDADTKVIVSGKEPSQTTKEHIITLAKEIEPNLMAIGLHGRKNEGR